MNPLNVAVRAHAWIITRTGGAEKSERGGGPLSEGIVQAGLAVFAVALVVLVVAKGNAFLAKITNLVP